MMEEAPPRSLNMKLFCDTQTLALCYAQNGQAIDQIGMISAQGCGRECIGGATEHHILLNKRIESAYLHNYSVRRTLYGK